ncbi:MAG: hypothetical protein KDA41_16080 [Planctomycetales bacterium]|nr:hypothetical protein [Planctomycetales bacterium]
MRRAQFDLRVNETLDQRQPLADDDTLTAAADCDEKRRWLADHELLLAAVEQAADCLETPRLGDDFAQRVVERHRRETAVRPAPTRSGRERLIVWLAVAAAAIAVVAAPWWLSARHADPAGAGRIGVAVAPSPPVKIVAPVEPQMAAASAAAREDAPQVEDEQPYADIYQAIVELGSQIPSADGDESLLAARPLWIEDMAVGLRPVANSVGGALSVLRRNLPPGPGKGDTLEKPQASRFSAIVPLA